MFTNFIHRIEVHAFLLKGVKFVTCATHQNLRTKREQVTVRYFVLNDEWFNNSPKTNLGYGGGYNERERVEYKEHVEESDDEYDEFGRRKKRDGKVVTTKAIFDDAQKKTDLPTAKIRDSDEEESDEDSDDADLR